MMRKIAIVRWCLRKHLSGTTTGMFGVNKRLKRLSGVGLGRWASGPSLKGFVCRARGEAAVQLLAPNLSVTRQCLFNGAGCGERV